MSTTTLIRPAHIESLTELFVVVGHPASPTLEVAHSTPECPEIVTPADSLPFAGAWHPVAEADGWLCSTCIDVDAVGFSEMDTDSPLRTGTAGPGTPVDSVPEVISWTKHGEEWVLRIPRSFEAKVGDTVTVTKKSGETAEVVVGEKVGTRKGDLLHRPGRKAEATVGYRWRKVDGEWLVAGPAAEVGSTITITKASGETVEAVVTGHAGTDLHRVRKVEAATKAEAKTGRSLTATLLSLRDRIVEETGAQTRDRSIRVVVPASVLDVPDQPDAAYRIGWGWGWKGGERHTGGVGTIRTIPLGEASTIKLVEYLLGLSADEFVATQAAYGQHFHECGRCGSPLTDKDSKARGLGPDCAAKG